MKNLTLHRHIGQLEAMQPDFREDKATQAACVLLGLNRGKMSYMKLIKLMYLADRRALLKWGRPITFDRYFSMKHGPVLSRVLDRVNEGDPPEEDSLWHQYISRRSRYEIRAKAKCPSDRISEAEVQVLHEVYEQFGKLDKWDLVDQLHEMLGEWQDPGDSAVPIAYRDILLAGGKSEIEVAAVARELEEVALLDQFLD